MRDQVLAMEKAILGKLEWYLTVPTPYVFLVRYIKASLPCDNEMENMTLFLAELGLTSYSIIIEYRPSLFAASAVYAARCTLRRGSRWTETLKLYTGYAEEELMYVYIISVYVYTYLLNLSADDGDNRECAKVLVGFHGGGESKLKAVLRKYSNPERGAVALFPPARALLH